jgi:lysophospholipase L1-like esterase
LPDLLRSSLSRRLALASVVVLLAAGSVAGCGASGDPPAKPAAPAAYVALGDSYASGVGAKPYSSDGGACLRSTRAYPRLLGRTLTSFRACAGATTRRVLRDQLDRFPLNTRLVTITIGGNDAGFADVVASCLLGTPAACERRVARAERFVRDDLPARLRRVYESIRERAPQATVVVAGYPRLLARAPWCGAAGRIDDREQRALNAGADLLARAIAAEVRRHERFRYVDVRQAFDDHGVCSRDPWIHAVAGIASFHATARGYAAYAVAIRAGL